MVRITKEISIHAPAKGATSAEDQYLIFPPYFNPRSREGSDPNLSSSLFNPGNFNPRSREGSDHAALKSTPFCLQNFNPRSREGSDFKGNITRYLANEFQSTLPRRERPCKEAGCGCFE